MVPKRWIVWSAVSSKPQAEKASLEEQRLAGQKIANHYQGIVVATLEVPGHTRDLASLEEAARLMPAYAQLLDLLERKAADVLVCWDMSRLGRTTALVTQVVTTCHRNGVAIYSRASPPASLDAREQARNEGAVLMVALESALAQVEIIKLKSRNEFGMADRAREGFFPHDPPYGYQKLQIGKNIHYQIVEEHAIVIRKIANLYLDHNWSQSKIARQLNSEAVIPPAGYGKWTADKVGGILGRADIYAGWAIYNRASDLPTIKAPGRWDPILSEEQHLAIFQARKDRVRVKRAARVYKYRFAKAVFCAICGSTMHAHTQLARGRRGKYIGYRCNETEACHHYISERKIRLFLEAEVKALGQSDDLESLATNQPDPRDHIRQELAAVAARLSTVQDERQKLLSLFVRLSAMTEQDLDLALTELTDRQEILQARQAELEAQLGQAHHQAGVADRLRTWADIGLDILNHKDPDVTNNWIRRHMQIYVRDNQVLHVVYL